MTLPQLSPDMDFDDAANMVVEYLTGLVPLALWSVTRVENDRQTFLFVNEGNSYHMTKGGGSPWKDSYCIHMVAGTAPSIAPDAQSVPEYAAAGVNAVAEIGAYAGSPIRDQDGELFGAICGFDPQRMDDQHALKEAGTTIGLLGQLLSMVLASARARDRHAHELLTAQLAAETDLLTGLYNRRAWERIVADESDRYERYADPTVAMMMDLDHLKTVNDTQGHAAGDLYIQTAAKQLANSVKSGDFVARLGGDEFAVLLRNCTVPQAELIVERIYANFEQADVAGSLGWSPITVVQGFPESIAKADAEMYAAKAKKREQLSAP